ncbi:DNA translocase FtsK [Rhodococcus sp. UNC363MFTsu5.1]|uniref:DNA translocase FtsK n=1 Tax=Rhodococcus sp. UNC363MFTsu5.1 TaxID=1449069 RepID=UPI00068F2A57|nr:DNA translocase FtsK [Rhodococcus sp. UNC363MFTsu5.1]
MAITIGTKALVDLLTDLVATASDVRGVHLRTVRGPDGDEPGDTTLLVGTSTNGAVLGHTWTQCTGELPPMIWPTASCDLVIGALKRLGKGDKLHAVDVSLDGDTVTVVETATLFDDGARVEFQVGDLEPWPGDRLWRILAGPPLPTPRDERGDDLPSTPRTTWAPGALATLLQIATRRKEALHLFETHSNQIHRAQIGERWVGAVAPLRAWDHDDPEQPNTDVHLERPDELDLSWLAEYRGGVFVGAPVFPDEKKAAKSEPVEQPPLDPTMDAPPAAESRDLVAAAAELVVAARLGSGSMLQRKLNIGFARAQELLDDLAALGIVDSGAGGVSRAREVLVDEAAMRARLAAREGRPGEHDSE